MKTFILLFILCFNCNFTFAESEIQFRFKNAPNSTMPTIKGIKVFYQATKPAFNSYARLSCEQFGMAGWSFRKINAFIPFQNDMVKISNEIGECNLQITEMLLVFNVENRNILVPLYPSYDTPQNIDLSCNKNSVGKFECFDTDGNDGLNTPINKKTVNITILLSKP